MPSKVLKDREDIDPYQDIFFTERNGPVLNFRQMKANYSSNSLVSDIPQSFNNGLSSAHIGEEDSNILL